MTTQLIVFDMAGTTVENSSAVHQALIAAFKEKGYTITHEQANDVMGYPKPVAIRILLKQLTGAGFIAEEKINEIYHDFVENMVNFYQNDASVKEKEGASEAFRLLQEQGVKVAIDTGFSRKIADVIIHRLGWAEKGLLDYSVTSDEVAQGRPYPDMIYAAMKACNVTGSENVVKVGDTASDMEQGTNAGCKYVIGITTGAFTKAELQKSQHTHLVETLDEVVSIVLEKQMVK